MKERNETNEPDLDAWQPLRAATARALKMFHGKQFNDAVGAASLSTVSAKHEDECSADCNRGAGDEKTTEQHRAYVDQRLKDFAAFERRAMGLDVRPRRGALRQALE